MSSETTLLNREQDLSPHQRALLERRLRGAQTRAAHDRNRIPRRTDPGPAPLSYGQEMLWVLDRLCPGSPQYNLAAALRWRGPLDRKALERALNLLVARHATLRTRIAADGEQPVQLVIDEAAVELAFADLAGTQAPDRDDAARRLMREEVRRPFDLTRDVLLRALLIRVGDQEHRLLLTLHHIAADGWSLGVLFKELSAAYSAFARGGQPRLPDPPIDYADFSVWQRHSLEGERMEQLLAYWRRHLDSAPEDLELTCEHRCEAPRAPGAFTRIALDKSLTDALRALSRREGVTLFMTLFAAFKTLLHRYSRQTDIVVGTPVAGRMHLDTEGLIGFFVNTLALRDDLSGDPPFTGLLRRVRETVLSGLAHQEMPFGRLVEELRPSRSPGRMPLVPVMFVLQNAPPAALQVEGVQVAWDEVHTGTAKFGLNLLMMEDAGGMVAGAEYNCALFDDATIQRLLGHFRNLLAGIVAGPARRLSQLPLLDETERTQLLTTWNATQADYPRDRTIVRLFEEQAEQTPAAIAVTCGQEQLTYRELNERANQLAHALARRNVGDEACVGIYLERSPQLIVAMLAILKAGAAYLPLDRAWPGERIAGILADARVPLLITDRSLADELPQDSAPLLQLDDGTAMLERESCGNLPGRGTGDSLAYVIYTSGSTGRPKGTCVTHRAISRLVRHTDYAQLQPDDVVAQVSNCSFDAATFEIWGALLNGARLVILPRDIVLSPQDFADQLRVQGITTLFLTTALFNQIARDIPDAFRSLRHLLFGGERCEPHWVREVLRHGPPQRLLHVYGPTETTTFATWQLVGEVPDEAKSLPIGRPLANTRVYVLDEHLQPVPVGVAGELHIGGDGVAREYLNRPELTTGRFIPDPFQDDPGARLYQTGDLVRWLPEGALEFLGRLDHQVKVRGFRVEPGEIEAVLNAHSTVRECIVVAHADAAGEQQLAAYVVTSGPAPTDDELRRHLRSKLPDYMVPAAFVRLEALPLNANGKVDRRALPPPDRHATPDDPHYVAPRDDLEARLANVWSVVLGVQSVGAKDRFFNLGGHSLQAVRLATRLEKEFGRQVPVAEVFRRQTVEELAGWFRNGGSELSGSHSALVPIRAGGRRPPLFLVHGVGGGMFWGYSNLARQLGDDQPVFAFAAQAGGTQPDTETVESMAARYVADLRQARPHGPYRLGGYCFGGNIAYEMARQIEAQGGRVSLLALMNCAPPNSSYNRLRPTPSWLWRFLRNLVAWADYALGWNAEQRRAFLRWKTRGLWRRLAALPQPRRSDAEGWRVDDLVDLSTYSGEERRLWEAHIHALAAYRPQAYAGCVTLFRSRTHPLLCSFDERCGWGELARGGVEVRLVPGEHESILVEPHVQALAADLRRLLVETETAITEDCAP
jgi:amino acid adenylation domain-containing protein